MVVHVWMTEDRRRQGSRLSVEASAVAVLLACAVVAHGQQPSIGQARISPLGDRVLALASDGNSRAVVVMDLGSGEREAVLRNGPGQSLGACDWVSNERFVCELFVFSERNTAPFGRKRILRLVAVDHDGRDPRQLLDKPPRRPPKLGGKGHGGSGIPLEDLEHKLVHRLPGEPDHVLVSASRVATPYTTVYRVHTRTGKMRRVVRWQQGILFWHADWEGRVRLGTGAFSFGDVVGEPWFGPVAVTSTPKGGWKRVDVADLSVPIGRWDVMGPRVRGFSVDGTTAYVEASVRGADRVALWAADSKTLEPLRSIKAHPERDVRAIPVGARDCGIVGFSHSLPGDPFTWLDREFGRQVARATAAEPGAKIVAVPSMSDDCQTMVLVSTDERTFVRFHLFDRSTGESRHLGGRSVDVASRGASKRSRVRFDTRDGKTLPMALTLPTSGAGIAPTVVLLNEPETNPERLDAWPHFFASRGYAVAQPAFRGVRGYGATFQIAGREMEGRRLQEDVEDALAWLSRKGVSDVSRACFTGRGRGGHLALAAALTVPDGGTVRRCAAAFAVRNAADTKRRLDEPLDYRVCGWYPCGDWESWSAPGHRAVRMAARFVPERFATMSSTRISPVVNAPHPGFPILIKTSGEGVVHERGSRRFRSDLVKTGFIDNVVPGDSPFEEEFLEEAADLFDEVLLGAERPLSGSHDETSAGRPLPERAE